MSVSSRGPDGTAVSVIPRIRMAVVGALARRQCKRAKDGREEKKKPNMKSRKVTERFTGNLLSQSRSSLHGPNLCAYQGSSADSLRNNDFLQLDSYSFPLHGHI